MSYDGIEKRKENIPLQDRVRDLEENDRASTKSRQAMHKQIGDLDAKVDASLKALNVKLDMILSKQDDKVEECAEHKTETALLKQDQAALTKALTELAGVVKIIQDDQKQATKGAIVGLGTGLLALGGYIWNMTVGGGKP